MNSKKDENRKSMKKNVLNNQEEPAAVPVKSRTDVPHAGKRKVCACCGKSLPPEDFYLKGVSQAPDHYCKACRRAAAARCRAQRSCRRVGQLFGDAHRQLITTTDDASLRMKLIISALDYVRMSKLRRRAKNAVAEDYRVDKELDEEEKRSEESGKENEEPMSDTEKRKEDGKNQ